MGQAMPGCQCTIDYFKSIVDPFELGDQKVGWGCMVPTTTPQAYFRGSTTAATDGSLTIAILPCVFDGILIWNTSVTTAPFNGSANFGNTAAINANCGEGRVVSIGVRAFPNIALTSIPGACYTGATVATTVADFQTLTTTDFVQLPTSHLNVGIPGGTSTGRPVDPESFIFATPIVDNNGYTATANNSKSLPFSVPYISFVGLPASATVFFEACINLEATQTIAHAGQTVLSDSDGNQKDTVGDHWPSADALWRAIRPYLPHPGRAGEATAAKDASYLQTMWSGITGGGKALAKGFASAALGAAGASLASPAMQLMGMGGVSGQSYGKQMRAYRL